MPQELEIGVDERAELHRRFDGRVKIEAEPAKDVQVRPQARTGHHDVGLEGAAVHGFDNNPGVHGPEGADPDAGVQFDLSRLHEPGSAICLLGVTVTDVRATQRR